jgi:hypothetical protein
MTIQYPKWKYHRTLDACIVQDPAEEAALGDGWADTPAVFSEPEPEPADIQPELAAGETEAPKKRGKAKKQ